MEDSTMEVEELVALAQEGSNLKIFELVKDILKEPESTGLPKIRKVKYPIIYAYFGRNREYSFHKAESVEDILETIPYGKDLPVELSGLYEDDDWPEPKNRRLELMIDEWIIFGTDETALEFYNLIKGKMSRNRYDEDLE